MLLNTDCWDQIVIICIQLVCQALCMYMVVAKNQVVAMCVQLVFQALCTYMIGTKNQAMIWPICVRFGSCFIGCVDIYDQKIVVVISYNKVNVRLYWIV